SSYFDLPATPRSTLFPYTTLFRSWRFEGSGWNVGPSEVDYLHVHEVDQHGDSIAGVLFDPDDLDGAYAELDRRYAAGEAAPYARSEEHTSELQSRVDLVCRLLLEK